MKGIILFLFALCSALLTTDALRAAESCMVTGYTPGCVITLTWTHKSTTDQIRIYRNLNKGAFTVSIDLPANTKTWADSTLVQTTTPNVYCWQISAVAGSNESARTAEQCYTVPVIGTQPDTPGSLAIVLSEATQPPLTINWTAPKGIKPTAKDWVALYRAADPDKAMIAGNVCAGKACWEYTNGAASGTFIVTPPGPGTYDVRYFPNDGFTSTMKSRGAWIVK